MKPYQRINNLGKFAHKPKVDVGNSEDDMSAGRDPRKAVNAKKLRDFPPSPPPSATKARRG
jgi:hypothetical protein